MNEDGLIFIELKRNHVSQNILQKFNCVYSDLIILKQFQSIIL